MVWLIPLAILCGLAVLPVGISAIYCAENSGVWLVFGWIRIRVIPFNTHGFLGRITKLIKPKDQKKKTKPEERKSTKKEEMNIEELLAYVKPLIRVLFQFLGDVRRKIRVRNLEMNLVLAGDDPCDLAVNYGRAWAAIGSLMPVIERFFVIKKRNIDFDCDFAADRTQFYGRLDVTITLGRAVHLVLQNGIRLLKEFIHLKKLQKGGAQI